MDYLEFLDFKLSKRFRLYFVTMFELSRFFRFWTLDTLNFSDFLNSLDSLHFLDSLDFLDSMDHLDFLYYLGFLDYLDSLD